MTTMTRKDIERMLLARADKMVKFLAGKHGPHVLLPWLDKMRGNSFDIWSHEANAGPREVRWVAHNHLELWYNKYARLEFADIQLVDLKDLSLGEMTVTGESVVGTFAKKLTNNSDETIQHTFEVSESETEGVVDDIGGRVAASISTAFAVGGETSFVKSTTEFSLSVETSFNKQTSLSKTMGNAGSTTLLIPPRSVGTLLIKRSISNVKQSVTATGMLSYNLILNSDKDFLFIHTPAEWADLLRGVGVAYDLKNRKHENALLQAYRRKPVPEHIIKDVTFCDNLPLVTTTNTIAYKTSKAADVSYSVKALKEAA